MFDDFRLRVFYFAAQEENYSRAAKLLHISQPAVSTHINELENLIGDTLFVREHHSMRLTSKGKALLSYAERILGLYDMLNGEILPKASYTKVDNLSICANQLAAKYLLPDMIQSFQQSFPYINISLSERDDEEINDVLVCGDYDIGILAKGERRENLEYSPFAELSLSLTNKPMTSLDFAFSKSNSKIELIKKFALCASLIK